MPASGPVYADVPPFPSQISHQDVPASRPVYADIPPSPKQMSHRLESPSRTQVPHSHNDASNDSPRVSSLAFENNSTAFSSDSLPLENCSITASNVNVTNTSGFSDGVGREEPRISLSATKHAAFAMSVSEARDQMRTQRSRDRARITGMTTGEKYNIYQQL